MGHEASCELPFYTSSTFAFFAHTLFPLCSSAHTEFQTVRQEEGTKDVKPAASAFSPRSMDSSPSHMSGFLRKAKALSTTSSIGLRRQAWDYRALVLLNGREDPFPLRLPPEGVFSVFSLTHTNAAGRWREGIVRVDTVEGDETVECLLKGLWCGHFALALRSVRVRTGITLTASAGVALEVVGR